MKLHHEAKAIDGYDLMVAKGGPKLKEAAPATTSASQSIASFGPDGANLTYGNIPAAFFALSLFETAIIGTGWFSAARSCGLPQLRTLPTAS